MTYKTGLGNIFTFDLLFNLNTADDMRRFSYCFLAEKLLTLHIFCVDQSGKRADFKVQICDLHAKCANRQSIKFVALITQVHV